MAFHKLQSEKGRNSFLEEISRVEEFLIDPWSLRVTKEKETVQVTVPRIVKPVQAVTIKTTVVDGFGSSDVFGSGGSGDGDEIWSVQKKQASLQKKAAVVSLAAEDFARRTKFDKRKTVSLGNWNPKVSRYEWFR
ncbi:hypothetical protein BVC80_9055g24 [Macleaya cordata]|uniref:Uncharacterized protein n=1 Tax=Macleaya cordata TaxID=56857 RepID=A0A200R9L1_MACCD|nr:hypothetical protein BVC80_9055g24 [Macleaya cordata]